MMNYGSRVLLSYDEQGREISGGDSDVETRGGVFGAQGYGGGIFDGSMEGLGGLNGLAGPETDCTILCAPLMLSLGPAGVAVCAAECAKQTFTKDCFVPSVCKSVAAKFPQLLDPNIINTYCQLPPETQSQIEGQCNAIAWAVEQSGGQVPPPSSLPLPVPIGPDEPLPPVPPAPGPGPGPTPTPEPGPPKEAHALSGGVVATVAVVAVLGLAFLLTGKGKH